MSAVLIRAEYVTQQHRTEWERTRWLVTMLLQPHTRKGSVLKPQDLMRFPWERQKARQLVSDEEFERLQGLLDVAILGKPAEKSKTWH